jgi:glycosidase
MWALRRSIAQSASPLSDIDVAVRSGEDAWKGSGAVMGLIVGNHDVPRFASVSAGDADLDGWSPSPQSSDPQVYAKQRLALALAYTLPGAPVVYQGDELALSGRRDPDARRPMPAESALTTDMHGVRDFVTHLAKLRDCSGALRRGAYRTIAASDEILAFARELDGAAPVIVVVTRSPIAAPSGIVPAGWVDLLTGRTGTDGMGALDIAVFQPASSACAH